MTEPLSLAGLEPGRRYRIEAVDTRDPAVLRLMVLGLVEGAEIELASAAIGGDPVEYRLFGAALSLRREHARCFSVAALD